MQSNTLQNISKAQAALSKATSLKDILEIRDQAEAVRVYIKAAKQCHLTANAATEIKLRAERKAGELLASRDKAKNQHSKTAGNTMLPAETLEDLGVSKMQASRWQQEASVPEDTFQRYIDESNESETEITQSGLLKLIGKCHVSNNSGENEWYTPSKYIEAARIAMGGIDLDPASCDVAQQNVKAGVFYTQDTDGLSKRWFGNVWLNPPYSKDLIGRFAEKICQMEFSQACILVNNATESRWFQQIAEISQCICLVHGRIKFLNKDNEPMQSPLQGQAILYIGDKKEQFRKQFMDIGIVLDNLSEVSNGR